MDTSLRALWSRESRGKNTWEASGDHEECALSHPFPLKIHRPQTKDKTRLEMGSASKFRQEGGELARSWEDLSVQTSEDFEWGHTELNLGLRRLSPRANCSMLRTKALVRNQK